MRAGSPKFLAAAIFAAALGFATPSFAISFLGGVTVASDAASDPALVIVTDPTLGTSIPLSFDLAGVGSTWDIDPLFKIGTTESSSGQSDDKVQKTITATFSFTDPDAFGGPVVGYTQGILSVLGDLVWSGPITLDFGNGGKLLISLSDAIFPVTIFNHVTLKPVNAHFELVAAPTAVPLPGAAWLFGTGVAALGLLRRQRRAKKSPLATLPA